MRDFVGGLLNMLEPLLDHLCRGRRKTSAAMSLAAGLSGGVGQLLHQGLVFLCRPLVVAPSGFGAGAEGERFEFK